MLQVHTCVSVHCAQCGEGVGGPEFEAHYPSEAAALDAAQAQGWLVDPGERWWCSACGPVLTCEVEGHEFTEWRHPRTKQGVLGGTQYRHCRRCCLHESRPAPTFEDRRQEAIQLLNTAKELLGHVEPQDSDARKHAFSQARMRISGAWAVLVSARQL